MKLATWNVNGIRAREAQAFEWLSRERPEIVALQEIKASPEQVPPLLCEMEGYWCYWHGFKGYSGVGLHVRKESFPERPEFSHPAFDMENRVVAVRLGRLVVASVYVPNGGKDFEAKMRFLAALESWLGALRAEDLDVLVCGDLNVARLEIDIHPKERKPNQIGATPEERAQFQRLLDQGVVDLGRKVDPDNEGLFTWWAPWRNMRQKNIGWRIDYVLASERLAERVTRCVVQPEVGTSDHAPVIAEFA